MGDKLIKYIRNFVLLIVTVFLIIVFFMPEPEGFPVLEYHTITDTPEEDSERYNVTPAEFNSQLDYLKENGYNTITMRDFIEAKNGRFTMPDNPIILTFDDGYEDNYTNMLPILEAHNMKAVVYVIANNIGKPEYLTFEELRDMQNRGIEIGCHTANHRPLTELNREELMHEISDSKIYLEWNGINYIISFSYPNGLYNDESINIIKEQNYFTAVTGEAGLNNFETDQYLMHRVNIPEPHLGIFEFRLRLLKAKLFAILNNS